MIPKLSSEIDKNDPNYKILELANAMQDLYTTGEYTNKQVLNAMLTILAWHLSDAAQLAFNVDSFIENIPGKLRETIVLELEQKAKNILQ